MVAPVFCVIVPVAMNRRSAAAITLPEMSIEAPMKRTSLPALYVAASTKICERLSPSKDSQPAGFSASSSPSSSHRSVAAPIVPSTIGRSDDHGRMVMLPPVEVTESAPPSMSTVSR